MKRNRSRSAPDTEAPEKMIEKENEHLRSALVEIAAENWRFEHALKKVLQGMDIMEAERFSRQYSYFSSRVSQAMSLAGLTCLDMSGQLYDVGMAVQGMNLEEFEEEESLIITRMVEPVILWNGRVVRSGMAMLGRAAHPQEAEEEQT